MGAEQGIHDSMYVMERQGVEDCVILPPSPSLLHAADLCCQASMRVQHACINQLYVNFCNGQLMMLP